ncbi:hypothetical protein [Paenibacillus fonticola]|uniref:hypothetical protein n=1 Tax=Paenibacillus fonticola TaxID=379896 RepID=UPI00036BF1B4|nr:hypothetical protein [Paenibacillus fonticola]
MKLIDYVILSIFVIAALMILFRVLSVHRAEIYSPNVLAEKFSNFFGYSSKGMKQVRGNGYLTLTKDALNFKMYFPLKIVEIPISQIIETEIGYEHLGKINFYLLRIRYNADDCVETVAWRVADAETWSDKINELKFGT